MYVAGLGATAPATLCSVSPTTLVSAFQRFVNVALDHAGYESIAVTGQIDPATCGAGALLASMGKDCPESPEAKKVLEKCLGPLLAKMPTSGVGALGAVATTSALCNAWKNPAIVRAFQRFLNDLRSAAGMSRITETGTFDDITCAAFVEMFTAKCPGDAALAAQLRACSASAVQPKPKSMMGTIMVGGGLLALLVGGIYYTTKRRGR